jgi:folate-dependent phosphoribosylglycinamide formyltransferase PurN
LYKSPKNISLILWPSIRSIAYLQVLEESNITLNEIIILKNNHTLGSSLLKEKDKYNYDNYFKIKNINELLKNSNSQIYYHNSSDINDPNLLDLISALKNKYVIFSGGGILKNEILSLNKLFIHIHPGIIPDYRGSTCFYYSLLNENYLGASAFLMNEDLDAGDIIVQNKFKLNYFINNDQNYFIDYIVDNYIRAQVLRQALKIFWESDNFRTINKNCTGTANYIMHPLLRHLTIKKINQRYNPNEKEGILSLAVEN